ncbi:MAG: hypothetical protein AAGH53_10925 [Pseudomonadota bacterium]
MSVDLATAMASTQVAATFDPDAVCAELNHWFFDVYINHWVDVGAGRRDDGPEFILQYWGTPMFVTNDKPALAAWLLTGEEIIQFLAIQHQMLEAGGYSHTHVPDKTIRAYNNTGGAIEVIWSRRASDETEIQRFVVHFECAKFGETWKVVGVHSRATDAALDGDKIAGAWAHVPSEEA